MAPCESKPYAAAGTPVPDSDDLMDKSGCDSAVKHPCPQFMERAIYLSRVAGLEKRTGMFIHSRPAFIE